jgi:hypothetical protein
MALYAQWPCLCSIFVANDFESLLFQSADNFQAEVGGRGTGSESDQTDATGWRKLGVLNCGEAFYPMGARAAFGHRARDEFEARTLTVPDNYG